MQLEEKDLNFIILCPELNIGGLRTTVSSIKVNYPGTRYLCAIAEEATKEDTDEIGKICSFVVGKGTITSLINQGMESSQRKWNSLVMAGVFVKKHLLKKISRWLESDRDIFYPIVGLNNWRFENSSLNGFSIQRDVFKDIGKMADKENNLEICRLFWALRAIEKGYKFKGIVGLKP
jgi:hypothetical protein